MDTEDVDISPTGREASIEDWRAKVDRLQEVVCMLLIKNQALRMASSIDAAGKESTGSA